MKHGVEFNFECVKCQISSRLTSFYDFSFAHKKNSVYISTSFFLWLMTFIRLVLVIRDEPETTIEKEKVCFFR